MKLYFFLLIAFCLIKAQNIVEITDSLTIYNNDSPNVF